MASFSKHLLIRAGIVVGVILIDSAFGESLTRARFHSTDPMKEEPPPQAVLRASERPIDPIYDFIYHTLITPSKLRKEPREDANLPAADTNTLGDVPDSTWFTNRHATHRMTRAELERGPGNTSPPVGKWRIIAAKKDGITPGFTIEDAEGKRYLIKLDPPGDPELASGADMIGSKLFYALGYATPENYIVRFRESDLAVSETAKFRDTSGRQRRLTSYRIHRMLLHQPRDAQGRVRALASKLIAGQPLGPFRYSGTRTDDPNDVIRHENRRSLRALAVFCAWTNHTDSRAQNSLDMLVGNPEQRYIQHHLLDFGSMLGSDSVFVKETRRGNQYDIDLAEMRREVFTLGLRPKAWSRARVPQIRGVGRFEAATFHPEDWRPAYPNPAFLRMHRDDAFWAARQVSRFTDDDLRAIAATAEYSDPEATEYVARVLMERRNRIVVAWTHDLLPIDNFAVQDGRLAFEQIPYTAPMTSAGLQVEWFDFDNRTGVKTAVASAGLVLPSTRSAYLLASVRAYRAPAWTDVYLRRRAEDGWDVVGVERSRDSELAWRRH